MGLHLKYALEVEGKMASVNPALINVTGFSMLIECVLNQSSKLTNMLLRQVVKQ